MKRWRVILLWLVGTYTVLFWAGVAYDAVSVWRHWHRLLGFVAPVDAGLAESQRAELERAIVSGKLGKDSGEYLNGWINVQAGLCNAQAAGPFVLQRIRSGNLRHSLSSLLIQWTASRSDQWKITLGWMPYLDAQGHAGRGFDEGARAMFGTPGGSLTDEQRIERLKMGRSPSMYVRAQRLRGGR